MYVLPGLGVGVCNSGPNAASQGAQAVDWVTAHLKAAHASGQLPLAAAFAEELPATDLALTSGDMQGDMQGDMPSDMMASQPPAQAKGRKIAPGRVVFQEELEKVEICRTASHTELLGNNKY